MENKETGTARPLGICEKFFHALHLNPTFRTLRRVGYHPQEPVAAAAAVPAAQPPAPAPAPVAKAPAPPAKSSGLEYPGGASGSPHQAAVSEKESPVARLSSESMTVPLKAPSKAEPPPAAPIPSKKFTHVETPAAAPPSRLPTGRTSSTPAKVPPPPPTPAAPPPEKLVSKLDDTKAGVEDAKPAAAAEAAARTRTRKNSLNVRVDEYINRTMNRMRTGSNAGSSSSKG